ncbi:lysM and putative peptidoglycan-binding domain-containing protein 3 isoform X2 [Coccinella septempunctata]|uniref:lysM and putative peptidoglycan-binding domain-containing protein 3 isoform X2 n=1 Tax=Coccinella septempunctata TaxID=41139 RepID=UPI001D072275|nr:lysM and putative peptidoglycan-binding domain-containing protein 3 isoform X2 [Coccinella septempunctata]
MMKKRHKYKYQKCDDESEEETELFVKPRTPRKEIPTVEKTVQEGDTLQSLAIRYCCTIEDIKRLNNIHKENEIYARNTIKVPVKPFSEALAPVHISGSTTPENKLIDIESPKINVIDLNLKIEEKSATPKPEVNEIIFNSQIAQKSTDANLDEVDVIDDEQVQLLPTKSSDFVGTLLNCNGTDGDISFVGLIIFIVVLIFAVPLIYVFYIAEHLENYHHHQT